MELEKAVIICVIITFAIIGISNLSIASSQNKGGFSLYNNTQYGFQLLYPKDWVAIEGDQVLGDFYTDIVTFEPSGEQGKHFSKKVPCGEVCLFIFLDNNIERQGLSLEQYADQSFNDAKKLKGFKLLDYKSASTLGNKKSFDMLYQKKQGNRDYIERYIGTPYGEKDNTLIVDYKSRTKFSDQTLPLANTMIDSFRFTKNNTLAPVDNK